MLKRFEIKANLCQRLAIVVPTRLLSKINVAGRDGGGALKL